MKNIEREREETKWGQTNNLFGLRWLSLSNSWLNHCVCAYACSTFIIRSTRSDDTVAVWSRNLNLKPLFVDSLIEKKKKSDIILITIFPFYPFFIQYSHFTFIKIDCYDYYLCYWTGSSLSFVYIIHIIRIYKHNIFVSKIQEGNYILMFKPFVFTSFSRAILSIESRSFIMCALRILHDGIWNCKRKNKKKKQPKNKSIRYWNAEHHTASRMWVNERGTTWSHNVSTFIIFESFGVCSPKEQCVTLAQPNNIIKREERKKKKKQFGMAHNTTHNITFKCKRFEQQCRIPWHCVLLLHWKNISNFRIDQNPDTFYCIIIWYLRYHLCGLSHNSKLVLCCSLFWSNVACVARNIWWW